MSWGAGASGGACRVVGRVELRIQRQIGERLVILSDGLGLHAPLWAVAVEGAGAARRRHAAPRGREVARRRDLAVLECRQARGVCVLSGGAWCWLDGLAWAVMAARAWQWHCRGFPWAIVAVRARASTLRRHLAQLLIRYGASKAWAARDRPDRDVQASGIQRLEALPEDAGAQVDRLEVCVPWAGLDEVGRDSGAAAGSLCGGLEALILTARTPVRAAGWARSPRDLASGRGDVVAGRHREDVHDHCIGHVDGGTGWGGILPEPGFVGELKTAALGEDGASLTLC
jgi:hypothetical protein